MNRKENVKKNFKDILTEFVNGLASYVSTEDGQWTIKGFIDVFRNVYTITADTKIVSKVLEIHLFPKMFKFAEDNGYRIVLADHQNYYPDMSFLKNGEETIKFAVDFKTTYRKADNPEYCNGFTLGSHGTYFTDRSSTKNIQFPYSEYWGHFCLGIIYTRVEDAAEDERKSFEIGELQSITSVIKDLEFFVAEKWQIACDKGGSGNTANIGSIVRISDIISGNGMFSRLGELWFDDYWMNFRKITVPIEGGKTKLINNLKDFVEYRGGDSRLIISGGRSR